MKKNLLKILFTFFLLVFSMVKTSAVQFDILVLPTDILSVCENYFCFPEVSEIVAEDVINNINSYNNMSAIELYSVRQKLAQDIELQNSVRELLTSYSKNEKIDFNKLNKTAESFGVKSIVIITSYTTSEKSSIKRNLWELLEISSAFKTSTPINLTTSAVLTDNVNNLIMWSGKYNKTVSDTNGYFIAKNQTQAASQYEKIKQYSKNNISQTISQNIHLRFFPKEIRTFKVNRQNLENGDEKPKFVPNALEHLINPQMIREIEEGTNNTQNPTDDFIFEF